MKHAFIFNFAAISIILVVVIHSIDTRCLKNEMMKRKKSLINERYELLPEMRATREGVCILLLPHYHYISLVYHQKLLTLYP